MTLRHSALAYSIIFSYNDEYILNKIKKHELTRADKEQDRINHFDYCNANTGPIFLTYKSKSEINEAVETDKRIDFIGGIRGLKELEKRVDNGMKVAFSMYPTTTDDLMAIADAGEVMPPKSTWFEPKLRSGLFIHDLG